MLLPAEITVVLLFIFVCYQSIAGWIKQRGFTTELTAQKREIDELTRRLNDAESNIVELDDRTKPPRKAAS